MRGFCQKTEGQESNFYLDLFKGYGGVNLCTIEYSLCIHISGIIVTWLPLLLNKGSYFDAFFIFYHILPFGRRVADTNASSCMWSTWSIWPSTKSEKALSEPSLSVISRTECVTDLNLCHNLEYYAMPLMVHLTCHTQNSDQSQYLWWWISSWIWNTFLPSN